MIGTTLAQYKVTAALGEGGMGEVWRAEDSKLGREVALKVLPEEFAQDPERMARFEREAKVLASLNHPNIAHLYGLESIDVKGLGEGFGPSRDDERGPSGAEAVHGLLGLEAEFRDRREVDREDPHVRHGHGRYRRCARPSGSSGHHSDPSPPATSPATFSVSFRCPLSGP